METLEYILGIGEEDLLWWQMSIRAVVVFFVSLLYVRIGNKRIFGRHSAFDIVLGIMYGSVMSRAITGNSPFFATLCAGLALVLLHWLLAAVAYKSAHGHIICNFIKGQTAILIKDGKMLRKAMEAHCITEADIIETLRSNGGPTDIKQIDTAYLERSGSISVVLKE